MTVMLFQKSPDHERTITSSASSSPLQALESTISDVFSLDHHHFHAHIHAAHNNNNNNNCSHHQEVPWHAIVFLFYALWFFVFIIGAALIFWLEHNFTRNDWRKHKTRRLEYIESLLQRKKLECSPTSTSATKCTTSQDGCNDDLKKDASNTTDDGINGKPKTIIICQSMTSVEDNNDHDVDHQQQQQQLPPQLNSTSCCICLEDFFNGDVFCYSSVCPHVFHENCMKQWLLRHDACPCCRQPYLALKKTSSSEEDDDITNFIQQDPSYVLPLDVWSFAPEDLPHWFIMTSEL